MFLYHPSVVYSLFTKFYQHEYQKNHIKIRVSKYTNSSHESVFWAVVKNPRRFKNGDEILLPPQLAKVRRIQQFDHLLLGTKTAAEVPTTRRKHLSRVDIACRCLIFRFFIHQKGFKRNVSNKMSFGWWQLKYFLFSTRKLGKMNPF